MSEQQIQTRGIVPDAPSRADDAIFTGREERESQIIVADRIEDVGHRMPEQWLRARVRGWMEHESPGAAYWIGTYGQDGRWIYCSSETDTYAPALFRQEYARKVCQHLNLACNFGGLWLTGWVRGGREFYLLWKDRDGDIQIPIEADKPFVVIQKWTPTDWEKIACTAWARWKEFHDNQEYGRGQQVRVAQGEQASPEHLAEAEKVVPL